MRLGTADVLVRAKTDQYKKDLNEAKQDTEDFGQSAMESTQLALGGFATLTAGLALTGASISSFINSAADQARELENMARLARMGTGEFATYAYATDRVGVSADKLADISKDVSDKLGDFLATGGGEFKDFFENVAPLVGVTAEELAKLSGPDALVAVKKAMDDANISAAQQVFYLESIADDAALLLPLLQDNSKALKEQAARARELGLELSDIDSQRLIEAGEATKELSAAFNGLTNRVAAEFSPAYAEAMHDAADLTVTWRDRIVETAAVWSSLALSYKDLLSGKLSISDFANMDVDGLQKWVEVRKNGLAEIDQQLDDLIEKRNNIPFSIDNGKSSGEAKAAIEAEISALRAQKQETIELIAAKEELSRAASYSSTHALADDSKIHAATAAYNEGRQSLLKYIQTQGELIKSEYESAVAFAKTDEERSKAFAHYQEQMASLARKGNKGMSDLEARIRRVDSALESAFGDLDKFEVEHRLAKIDNDLTNFFSDMDHIGGVDDELHKFFDDLDKQGGKTFAGLENAVEGWASGFSGTLNDMLWGADTTFGDIAESFGRMLTQMVIQKTVVEPLLNWGLSLLPTGAGPSAGSSGGVADFSSVDLSGVFSTPASAQGNVFSGPGISAYNNQIVSQPTFFPFAHGVGLMGEDGHEAIMPLTRMPGGDLGVKTEGGNSPVTVNVINNTDSQATVSERTNDSGGVEIEVLIDSAVAKNVNRHGSATNKAVRGVTGSSQQLIRR